jgi:hypothetical protein
MSCVMPRRLRRHRDRRSAFGGTQASFEALFADHRPARNVRPQFTLAKFIDPGG